MHKPTGKRGSWFANWDGRDLPCVHACWMKGHFYEDPFVTDDPKWGPFIDAIAAGLEVIVTNDRLDGQGVPVARNGYVGLFRVKEVRVDGQTLRFEFVERTFNFS